MLIGRNDQHGYNLHKRVASSINSICNILSENDEIIFVDWNSPVDMPPLLHSISDTLTPKAHRLTKILKVSGAQHLEVAAGSHRKVLEPIARNVGIRRSSPDASWVLSTNTDMLFHLPKNEYLKEILNNKQPSLLTIFRNEIPEYYWDSFDRVDTQSTNRRLQELTTTHYTRHILIEHKVQKQNITMPDGVGDFQLAPKIFWDQMGGFPEDKLLGWHNDTRLAIQMVRKLNCNIDILGDDEIVGFHQNHYRSLVEGHDNTNINSSDIVFREYENGKNWGLGNQEIEFFSFDKKFVANIDLKTISLGKKISVPSEKLDSIHSSINDNYERMLFFIKDDLSLLEENSKVIYIGVNEDFFESLALNLGKKLYRIRLSNTSTAKTIFEELKNFSVSDRDLVLFDLGIHSAKLNNTEPSSPEIMDIDLSLQRIYFRKCIPSIFKTIPMFANYLHERKLQTKAGFLRNQNWPTLLLTQKYFSMPLFNNYSGYLSGRARDNLGKYDFTNKYLFEVASNYYLGDYANARMGINIQSLAFRTYKKLPRFIRSRVHKIVSRFYLMSG